MKNVLITGVSSGIGNALCLTLLNDGYNVLALGQHYPTNIPENSGFTFVECDLTILDRIPESLDELLLNSGVQTGFDFVFLNAGQFCNQIDKVSSTSIDEIIWMQNLNCFSYKMILDHLIASALSISTVCISSSIAGVRARAGNGGYAVSKATLNMMMNLYALEHPEIFFAVLGLCVVETSLSYKIGTLPLPEDTAFLPQRRLRERAAAHSGYIVTPQKRAEHMLSLLLPEPDVRVKSGIFIEIRDLV
ncbi:MAG: SDR family NAD(P)-dependent oxidoreductase [Rhizobiales bacterium]|nr:SDR family NAD(P)-dependent oxidoreductase [Hyphomicrobiales bacterium]